MDNTRSKMVSLRISEREKAEIKKLADAAGLTFSDYMIRRSLEPSQPAEKRLAAIERRLKAIEDKL